jgi:hypothetical protein
MCWLRFVQCCATGEAEIHKRYGPASDTGRGRLPLTGLRLMVSLNNQSLSLVDAWIQILNYARRHVYKTLSGMRKPDY